MNPKKTGKKQLGIYWGHNGLYLVETISGVLKQSFSVPFPEEVKANQPEGGGLLPWNLQLVSRLQDTLRQQKIFGNSVYLSLPTKDIIFRSFVLPWMQSNEVKMAAEFEARKYIPFPLEELCYCSHFVLLSEKGTKRLRVFFVAIKRITLENYIRILTQAGLPAQVIEPAPLSLIRVLSTKKLIGQDKCSVFIEKEGSLGRITISNQGIPQFVREFELKLPFAKREESDEPSVLLRRFLNEVRISIDYFHRQDNLLDIKQGFLLSSSDDAEELVKNLNTGLHTSVTTLKTQSLLGDMGGSEIGYINAYGASLVDSASPAIFDFSKNELRSSRASASGNTMMTGLKTVLITAAVCVLCVVLVLVYLGRSTTEVAQKQIQLKERLGSSQNKSSDDLKEKSQTLRNKLENIKGLPVKSEASLFLNIIPSLLPEGTWLKDIELIYQSEKTERKEKSQVSGKNKLNLTIELSGYVYSENIKTQFGLVNTLLINIKGNKNFSDFFRDIVLETVNAQKLNDFNVTFFKIRCY